MKIPPKLTNYESLLSINDYVYSIEGGIIPAMTSSCTKKEAKNILKPKDKNL
jgi:hypothetical protein